MGLDAYTRNARLKPALLALAPAAWTVMAWSADHIVGWGGFWTLFVAAGGTATLSQLARGRGKRKESELFEKHGGRPTERLLSHERTVNKVTLARRHSALARLVPNIAMPSAADEAKDRRSANAIYASCVAWLIARTRDDRLLL